MALFIFLSLYLSKRNEKFKAVTLLNSDKNKQYGSDFRTEFHRRHNHLNYPYKSGLDIPVSVSSVSLFNDLPSRLRPFGLKFFVLQKGI
jgi:hypothetical protein